VPNAANLSLLSRIRRRFSAKPQCRDCFVSVTLIVPTALKTRLKQHQRLVASMRYLSIPHESLSTYVPFRT
jgi:hypothetical protein